jgi:hypothetical protein
MHAGTLGQATPYGLECWRRARTISATPITAKRIATAAPPSSPSRPYTTRSAPAMYCAATPILIVHVHSAQASFVNTGPRERRSVKARELSQTRRSRLRSPRLDRTTPRPDRASAGNSRRCAWQPCAIAAANVRQSSERPRNVTALSSRTRATKSSAACAGPVIRRTNPGQPLRPPLEG